MFQKLRRIRRVRSEVWIVPGLVADGGGTAVTAEDVGFWWEGEEPLGDGMDDVVVTAFGEVAPAD